MPAELSDREVLERVEELHGILTSLAKHDEHRVVKQSALEATYRLGAIIAVLEERIDW